MKNSLKKILSTLGLLVPLTKLKFIWSSRRLAKSNQQFRLTHPDFILPPDYMMYEAYGLDYKAYYEDGKNTASWLEEQIAPWMPAETVYSILDWGCGPARVMRHLPSHFPNGNIQGSDYNPETVQWLQHHFPAFNIKNNSLYPPLDFEAESVDFAYAISIFTHLSAKGHYAWIKEIARVLRPGGIFLFTTHGDVFRARLTKTEQLSYGRNELVVRGSGPEGHRVYGAFHPPAVISALIASDFELLKHEAGYILDGQPAQDTWIVRRKK